MARKLLERFPGARVVGVDPAPGMVEQAARAGGGAEFLVAPAERLPFDDRAWVWRHRSRLVWR